MNAYYLCMVFIFMNAGIVLVAGLNVFGNDILQNNAILGAILSASGSESSIFAFTLGGTILALAAIITAASAKINPTSSVQGVAIGAFATIFWISYGSAVSIIIPILNMIFPNSDYDLIVLGIFTAAGIFVFAMALIQFASGGVKTHG